MKNGNIGADWASFTDHLADQVTCAGGSHWGEKEESGNWPNLCSLLSEEEYIVFYEVSRVQVQCTLAALLSSPQVQCTYNFEHTGKVMGKEYP